MGLGRGCITGNGDKSEGRNGILVGFQNQKNKKTSNASELHTPALVLIGLITSYFVLLIRTEIRQERRILEPVRSDPFRVAYFKMDRIIFLH